MTIPRMQWFVERESLQYGYTQIEAFVTEGEALDKKAEWEAEDSSRYVSIWQRLPDHDDRTQLAEIQANTCSSCIYFKRPAIYEMNYDQGTCHRHAPTRVAIGINTPTIWPIVHQFDWCGDYAAAHG